MCLHNESPSAEIGEDSNVRIRTVYVSFRGTEDTTVMFNSPCASDAETIFRKKLRSTTKINKHVCIIQCRCIDVYITRA